MKVKGYLVTVDIAKAFDSLDHTFPICASSSSTSNFTDWVKIFLNKQESCVINGGITTKYFKLEKGAWQGNLCQQIFLYSSC